MRMHSEIPELPQPGARRGIQSVETGMRVLASLAAGHGPQALTAIGTRAGISPSQAHRYLQSLVAAGMAVQDQTSRYDLGPAAISVGIAALARMDAFAQADAAMAQFTAETGRTALLSVWGAAGAVLVRWFPGNPPIYTTLAIGSVLPLLRSATGQVFLAYLSESQTSQVLERALASDHAVMPVDIETVRSRVKAAQCAMGDITASLGLRAIAAPVFDLQGRLTMVATALATPAFAVEEDEAVAARLLAACRLATQACGGTWPA